MRGRAAAEGATYVSANGYHYTKKNGKFKATHIIIMEEHLGRPLEGYERVRFKNGDKTDLRIDNLKLTVAGTSSLRAKRARLKARIEELQGQLADLEREIELSESKAKVEALESSR